ncbi:MAG: tyrosine-type recombinase/integrase, partial [Lactobacillus amylovorus]|nr:tyrosine-type recombinase/integrase [Lactobacillus amylovorus]
SETVRQYRQELQNSGKKPTTVKNYIIAVKRFFEWTEEAGFYPNIAKYIKSGHLSKNFKKDYLTGSQARQILDKIDRSTIKGKRDYAMLVTMLTMGLRTIEVSRADIDDIRTKGNMTVLYVQGKGHDEKDDLIRMTSHVESAIRDYLSVRRANDLSEPLFTSTSNHNANGRMTTRSIRRIVKTAFISAGYDSPRLTAHSTRHTAATLSLLNGATLQQTQELLRHRNIGTTEIYAHNIDATTNPAATDVEEAIFGKDK